MKIGTARKIGNENQKINEAKKNLKEIENGIKMVKEIKEGIIYVYNKFIEKVLKSASDGYTGYYLDGGENGWHDYLKGFMYTFAYRYFYKGFHNTEIFKEYNDFLSEGFGDYEFQSCSDKWRDIFDGEYGLDNIENFVSKVQNFKACLNEKDDIPFAKSAYIVISVLEYFGKNDFIFDNENGKKAFISWRFVKDDFDLVTIDGEEIPFSDERKKRVEELKKEIEKINVESF